MCYLNERHETRKRVRGNICLKLSHLEFSNKKRKEKTILGDLHSAPFQFINTQGRILYNKVN